MTGSSALTSSTLSALPTPMLLPRCTGLTMHGSPTPSSNRCKSAAEGNPPAPRGTTA